MSAGDGAALWANPELARAYADVRTDLSPAARAVWTDAFRAAWGGASPRRVLDVGCGTGRFTAFLSDVFEAPTIGVDASAEMLRGRAAGPGRALPFLAADAAALPLHPGAVDLALLSMVYHFLKPPEPAVAELHRVVRPHGVVFVRTPTRELLDRVEFLAFFPEARAVDEARMPARAELRATFERAGFATHAWRIVEQEFATTPLEALARVRRRAFSTLRLISDEAFASGLARYEAHCLAAPPTPRSESLELFVFQRI
ncbi:MAG: methyltransferase domain-containing protein [Candidatus Rokubacteria bacterium]|nr:methyltransferase domain-containing protein [Candidatus Rokubacteria bacterium]